MSAQEHEERWRLFWAIPLPEEIHDHIAHLQEELDQQLPDNAVRWVRPEGIHLTLVFLGNWTKRQIPELAKAVRDALDGTPPFTLEVEAAGVFPNLRRPRVLWLGVGGDRDALQRVQNAVARAMVSFGWTPEKRPFSPHLTIGRVRKGVPTDVLPRIGDVMRRLKVDPFGKHQVTEVILYRSVLKCSGAEYTPVARVRLRDKA